jgi:hypothetical protein
VRLQPGWREDRGILASLDREVEAAAGPGLGALPGDDREEYLADGEFEEPHEEGESEGPDDEGESER